MEHFKLEGVTYFQQGRRCNKPGCDTLHGPYWFTRPDGGRVTYLGKHLPEDIERTRAIRDEHIGAIHAEIDELTTRITAMRRLERGDGLTSDDYLILKEGVFSTCLLSARRD